MLSLVPYVSACAENIWTNEIPVKEKTCAEQAERGA
jgi:hypothetical protein